MVATLRITAKGQVTLRKELLRHLGVAPGDKVVVDLLSGGRASLHAAAAPATIEDFIGSLQQPGTQPLSTAEIKELAARGWTGRK